MHISNRTWRAWTGAILGLATGCQSASFIGHDATVGSGTEVPLNLQVNFGPGDYYEVGASGHLVACVGLPEGWSAPTGTYTHDSENRLDAAPSPEVSAEAEQTYGTPGTRWHCLISGPADIYPDGESLATARLLLPVPGVAQGAYRLNYLTGFRPDGEATIFGGQLERLLHVNVQPATTFDAWDVTSFGTTGPISVNDRVWYGHGQFLLRNDLSLFSSTDGREWTDIEPTMEGTGTAIVVDRLVYTQDRWFGVSGGAIYVSRDDARTWAQLHVDPVSGREFLALAVHGNQLVASGTQGLIAVSSDGTEWTDQSANGAYRFPRLAVGQDTVLAVGEPEGEEESTNDILLRARADGSGWDRVQSELLENRAIRTLVWGNDRFLAFTWREPGETPSEEPPGNLFMSLDRGATWEPVRGLLTGNDAGLPDDTVLAYVDTTFVVGGTLRREPVGDELLPFELRSSADGVTWTAHATGAAGDFSPETVATGPQSVVMMSPEVSLVATRRPWAGPEFVTESLPYAVVGVAYDATVETRGGAGSTTLSLEGTLPAGLGFATGTVSGTPTQAGTAELTATARDVRGTETTRAYTLDVVQPLSIPAVQLATAVQGTAYSASFAVEGGRAPYTWSHTGALPAGLTLQQQDAAYVLSGTPAATGSFALTLTARDALGLSAERAVTLQVDPAPNPNPNPNPNPVPPPPKAPEPTVAPTPERDDSGGWGCSSSGAGGLNLLGFAALVLLRRRVRRKHA
ncbi:putative Ig domain-containing protein [Pyxidicoccus sp. 3LG]